MIPPSDLKYINETVLDLRVIVLNQTRLQELNFTWEVISFEKADCKLQLRFEKANYVSFDSEARDNLLLTVLKPEVFVSKSTG